MNYEFQGQEPQPGEKMVALPFPCCRLIACFLHWISRQWRSNGNEGDWRQFLVGMEKTHPAPVTAFLAGWVTGGMFQLLGQGGDNEDPAEAKKRMFQNLSIIMRCHQEVPITVRVLEWIEGVCIIKECPETGSILSVTMNPAMVGQQLTPPPIQDNDTE